MAQFFSSATKWYPDGWLFGFDVLQITYVFQARSLISWNFQKRIEVMLASSTFAGCFADLFWNFTEIHGLQSFFPTKTTESRLKVFQAPKRYRETLAEQALGLSIPSHKTCERDDQVFRLVDVILRINQRLCALQWKFYEAYNHWSACENKYLGSRITSRHPFERQNICFENLLIESFEKT